MRRDLPVLVIILLLSLPAITTAQAVPMDKWKITVESEIPLSSDVRKGIIGAAEYIIRELIPQWEEYSSIQCFCRVMEQEGEIYKVTTAISAEDANGEAVYIKVLFEYDAQNGGYVIKEGGSKPTTNKQHNNTTTTNNKQPPPPPPEIGITLWSRFELSKEVEKSIKDAAKRLVEERINVEESGGVAVECFVLKNDGEWYTIYARVFAKPPPGSPEASRGEAKAWEAAFKYNLMQGTYEIKSFSEVDNFLVPEDIKQRAMTIGEKDEKIKTFVTENAENNLTSQAEWINRNEGIVRLQYTATLLLNKTHALYKGLTAYIDVEGEEALHVEKHEGVWYAPGLKEAPEPGETGTPPTTTNAATSTPVEYYYGLSVILIAIVAGTLLTIRKAKS